MLSSRGLTNLTETQCIQTDQYSGEQRDSTNLTYLRARYLSTDLGVFSSKDSLMGSIFLPQSHNDYLYALANPLKYTDATGMVVDQMQGGQTNPRF